VAKVYFTSARALKYKHRFSLMSRFDKMMNRFGLSECFNKKEIVLIKLHMGNPGCNQTVRPTYVGQVVKALKKIGVRPVVTDSSRIEPYKYLQVANEIGYNFPTLGAPIVIADGIFGKDAVKVKAGGLLQEINIASAICDAPGMVVLSHCTGHVLAGYAGAI
jgi:hypothetical protein